jgi:predicted SAM-dependent methyltransferase
MEPGTSDEWVEPFRRRPVQAVAARLRDWTARFALTRRARRKLRDWITHSTPPNWLRARDDLAFRYLRGDGIEIGAAYRPLRVPGAARVRYVDHASGDELRRIYPDYSVPVVEPDVVDEGQRLATFADESLDFVIANHLLEHVEDPIEALRNFLRVLRPGGIVFLTLPDARHTFDRERSRTTVEHLLRDHREGPQVSRREHLEEIARTVDCVPEDQVAQRADEIAADPQRHHFHVWELETFVAFLLELRLPADLETVQATDFEFAVVLRKNPGKELAASGPAAAAQRQGEHPERGGHA